MYISLETEEQTEQRLKEVIRQSDLKIFEGTYFFEEFPLDKFKFNPAALAIVRDEEVWSQLISASETGRDKELFKIFIFHFPQGIDNSGFVGWLANTLKKELGTGVFVVCGQNTDRGGIFDYWGCPVAIADKAIKLITELRK